MLHLSSHLLYDVFREHGKTQQVMYQYVFTSVALIASACSSSVCALVVKPWCSSRLAAFVRDKWRWEGGAELNTWRRHCRAWLPLPLARQNRAASLWTCQRGIVAYIYTNKLPLAQKMNHLGSDYSWEQFRAVRDSWINSQIWYVMEIQKPNSSLVYEHFLTKG